MSTQDIITQKLQALSPEHLEVINESHMHNVPEGSESHFKVVIVSDAFKDKMLAETSDKVATEDNSVPPLADLMIESPLPAWAVVRKVKLSCTRGNVLYQTALTTISCGDRL